MSIKMKERCDEDAKLFKDVEFLIEANHNEQHSLWREFHYRPQYEFLYVKNWEQISMGRIIEVGTVDNRPIVISIFYAKLNGKKVMFYYGCSQLVDHKMIDDWIQMYTLETIRYDNGYRWAHCDAMNFHNCLHGLGIEDRFLDDKFLD